MMKVLPWRWFLYLLYGLVLTGALLYIRFPAEKFESFLLRKVEAAVPGSTCSFGSVHYNYPFTAVIDELSFAKKEDKKKSLLLENLAITPVAAGLGREFRFSTGLYDGDAEGRLKILPLKKRFTLTEVQLRGVKVEQLEYLQSSFRREVAGLMSGSGDYEGSWIEGEPRSGSGRVTVRDGSIVLRQPILAVGKLDFEYLEADFSLAENALRFSAGKLKGTPLHADFKGELKVKEDSPALVALTGTLGVDRAYMREKPRVLRVVRRMQKQYGKNDLFPFKVGGTMSDPNFRFGGE